MIFYKLFGGLVLYIATTVDRYMVLAQNDTVSS